MYHLLFQGIRQGLNFPGLGPHHQGAVTVSASPTVASSATTVPVATPVVDTYLSQGIGPISHGVSDICLKNESQFHLFLLTGNLIQGPTKVRSLLKKLHCSIAKMVHLVAQSFSWRHTILQDFLLKKRVSIACISTTTTRVVSWFLLKSSNLTSKQQHLNYYRIICIFFSFVIFTKYYNSGHQKTLHKTIKNTQYVFNN